MLQLFIMRHAKSSWAIPGARDIERELNKRGVSDLEKISREMIKAKHAPELVLCSPAVRTRMTLDGITGALNPVPEVSYIKELYSGGWQDYLEVIQQTKDTRSIMLIGHNPMCGSLSIKLYGSGMADEISKITHKYPTGTMTILEFDCKDWSEVEPGSGILRKILVPSKLS